MCCRYYTDESPELRPIVEEMLRSPLVRKWQNTAKVRTYGEIRPADVAAVIAPNRSGERAVFPMKWGFSEKTLLINARTETAAVRPVFKDAWARHRCIIPASWYFEWEHLISHSGKKKTGDKYLLQPKGSAITWLCGLYRIENGLPVFTILTREPGEEIRFIHDRMPLILPEELVGEWIRPDAKPEDLLPYALTEPNYERAG
ncbi:MAG: SOS response-associated peptidase family protein [Lachnospiraceae bacterium]|nr:SOS response-associated peptidase family protein [Lachnospiraceae bacterium]MBQ6197466.1 SOS response-associated peptidase family protein [Lachnospiraceae bacterium]